LFCRPRIAAGIFFIGVPRFLDAVNLDVPYKHHATTEELSISQRGVRAMKERLVVMNGTRVVQAETAPGQWHNTHVDKAGAIKPGVYALYLATPADKAKAYDGPLIHADKETVYQQTGKAQFIKHSRADFDKVPELGAAKHIEYAQGRAVVSAASASLSRGVKR
jgi:hypothetical protein